jgi:hypothetical protein
MNSQVAAISPTTTPTTTPTTKMSDTLNTLLTGFEGYDDTISNGDDDPNSDGDDFYFD